MKAWQEALWREWRLLHTPGVWWTNLLVYERTWRALSRVFQVNGD